MKAKKRFGTILVLLSGLSLYVPAFAEAQMDRLWGFGGFGGYSLPVLGMGEQFSGTGQFGLTAQIQYSPKLIMEVEYHRADFSDDEASVRTFLWPVDNQGYASPQAEASIAFNSVLLNLLISPNLPGYPDKKFQYYFIVGTGIYGYKAERRNFIFPGQTTAPLDTGLFLDPQVDKRAALGIHAGYGGQYFFSKSVALDLRGRYHLAMGDLRPMAAWGFESSTMPLQFFEVRAGLKFYFLKSQ